MNIIQVNKPGNTTAIGIFTNIGSNYEPIEIKGISHFIEHLLFKGTKHRTAKQLVEGIEKYGGKFNAYTSEEVVCYWAVISNKYKQEAIKIIKDMVANPLFNKKEIEKEREVIIQELKMYFDNPASRAYDLFNESYWNNESSLHFPIIGTKESLYNIQRKHILNYYKQTYQNLTLVIVGDVENKIKRNFITLPHPIKNLTKEKKSAWEKRKIDQANIIIGGYRPSSNLIETYYQLQLLKSVYNDMSGRLFTTIREKNNLVYRIRFTFELFKGGIFCWQVSLGLEKNKIEQARLLIEQELIRPFTYEEIKNGIQKFIGQRDLDLDNSNNILRHIVNKECLGIDYRDVIMNNEKIEEVSYRINDFIKQMDFTDNLMVGIIPK